METQTYANHRRMVPGFHGVLFFLLVLTLIGSGVNLYQSFGDHQRLYSASLIFVLTASVLILFFYCRIFALKAQDRAIRAEENLRHFVLTGKLLDPRIGTLETVALRFAPDEEFSDLARRAAEEKLTPGAIKSSIRKWKPDTYRV
jgi:hypothetical protein